MKLLSEVADESVVNSADEEGWAPIHSAASIGNVEIMEILLSKGEYIPIPYQKSTTFFFFLVLLLVYSVAEGWMQLLNSD